MLPLGDSTSNWQSAVETNTRDILLINAAGNQMRGSTAQLHGMSGNFLRSSSLCSKGHQHALIMVQPKQDKSVLMAGKLAVLLLLAASQLHCAAAATLPAALQGEG